MKNTPIVVVFVLLAIIAIGGYFYPVPASQVVSSGLGSTFGTAKIAAINMSPVNGSATSSSILNTDASDRWIQSGFGSCTGVGTSQAFLGSAGLAALLIQAATTSANASAGAGLAGNVNLGLNLTVSTSTTNSNNASSTVPVAVSGRWPSGSYLTFNFNATNTAACVVGVNYVPS